MLAMSGDYGMYIHTYKSLVCYYTRYS